MCSPKNVNTYLNVGYLKCQGERRLEGLYQRLIDVNAQVMNRSIVPATYSQNQLSGWGKLLIYCIAVPSIVI